MTQARLAKLRYLQERAYTEAKVEAMWPNAVMLQNEVILQDSQHLVSI